MNRRDFAKLITTTIIAGSSCKRPEFTIENKVKPESSPHFENIITYNTCFPYYPFPLPITVDTYEGIPFRIKGESKIDSTKIQVPPFALASNYTLFDNHRIKKPIVDGKETNLSWALESILSKINSSLARNKKVAIITTQQNSLFFSKLCEGIEGVVPLVEMIQLPIFDYYKSFLEASKSIFNNEIFLHPKINKKKVIVNFGSDFLNNDPFNPLFATQFNKKEQILITFEDVISLTGLNSTLRLSLTESEIFNCALSILKSILENKIDKEISNSFKALFPEDFSCNLPENIQKIINHHVDDFVFLCNPYFSPQLHIITSILNYFCNEDFAKNISNNFWIEDIQWYAHSKQKLKNLLEKPSEYELIIFLDYNPYFSLNKELTKIVENTEKAKIIHLSLYDNELSEKSCIFIPLQTYFEFWGDRKFLDGTVFFQQKIIEPINKHSISTFDFLFKLLNELLKKNSQGTYFNTLLEFYTSFDSKFNIKDAVRNGFKLSGKPHKIVLFENEKLDFVKILSKLKTLLKTTIDDTSNTLIIPCQNSYGGEYSKNVYLYEMPEPILGKRWTISYFKQQFTNVQNFEFKSDFIVYQNYDYLKRFFSINLLNINSKDVNFNYKFSLEQNSLSQFAKDFSKYEQNLFASIENIFSTLNESIMNISKQLYQNTYINKENQWAMIIDINKCIGCNLCMLACQIENNIPVVGKNYVSINRAMNWVDIVKISTNSQKFLFLPIICQHCDNAPCESVCPVGATSHSMEGINEMTYNQCIGSRICMANCPYKVRKFNFEHPEKVHLNYIPEMMNPFVTVRSRGVTEKCTFCIHRINFERTRAKLFGNGEDFDVKTACEEVCPASAIKFGRKKILLNIENKDELFVLLPEFNTLPNVLYKMSKNEPKNA